MAMDENEKPPEPEKPEVELNTKGNPKLSEEVLAVLPSKGFFVKGGRPGPGIAGPGRKARIRKVINDTVDRIYFSPQRHSKLIRFEENLKVLASATEMDDIRKNLALIMRIRFPAGFKGMFPPGGNGDDPMFDPDGEPYSGSNGSGVVEKLLLAIWQTAQERKDQRAQAIDVTPEKMDDDSNEDIELENEGGDENGDETEGGKS